MEDMNDIYESMFEMGVSILIWMSMMYGVTAFVTQLDVM